MFIWTAKVNRRKVALAVVAAIALCASTLAVTAFNSRGAQTAAAASPKGMKTEEDRVSYLSSWGWQVSPTATLVEELALPKEFGEEYSQYLSLQTDQGFDLAKHAGKRVKRYTYDVLNYPGGEEGVQIHLLVYKNTVVGGEVMGDGFLQGLEMPT